MSHEHMEHVHITHHITHHITSLRVPPQAEEIGLNIITTAKISTSFHGSPRKFQTSFHRSTQNFIEIFTE